RPIRSARCASRAPAMRRSPSRCARSASPSSACSRGATISWGLPPRLPRPSTSCSLPRARSCRSRPRPVRPKRRARARAPWPRSRARRSATHSARRQALPMAEAAPATAPEPARFGRFHLIRPLAKGGMAELFLARLPGIAGFEKELVVKRLLPNHAERPERVELFLDEARIAGRLSHPFVVHVYELGMEAGAYYIAMEYIKGRTLMEVAMRGIEAQRFLSLAYTCRLLAMVCEGLAYLHAECDENGRPLGIVHRDISPSNILVTYQGHAKIIDFGIAVARGLPSAEIDLVAGKCHYMAPEQLR